MCKYVNVYACVNICTCARVRACAYEYVYAYACACASACVLLHYPNTCVCDKTISEQTDVCLPAEATYVTRLNSPTKNVVAD